MQRGLMLVGAGLLPLAAMVWLACRPSGAQHSTAATGQEAVAIPIVLSGPEQAARSALLCLKAIHEARASRDEEAVSRYLEQLDLVAARDTIRRRFQTSYPHSAKDPEAAVDNFVECWAAVVGYYADGLDPNRVNAVDAAAGAFQVDVHATAAGSRGEATIRFECLRGDDGNWRVSRVDFAPRPAPSTQPSP